MNQPLEWSTVQRKVNDLLPMEINPRRISEAKRMKMIESLQKFNLVDIPVVDFDGTLISGHQRMRALQAIGRGEEMIDVRVPNRQLTELERKEYNILANTHFGEFDLELFEEHFGDVDLDVLGVDNINPATEQDLHLQEVDFSEKNREFDTEDFLDEMEMNFKFTKDEFMDIQERINVVCAKQTVDTKEEALKELLLFYERHGS